MPRPSIWAGSYGRELLSAVKAQLRARGLSRTDRNAVRQVTADLFRRQPWNRLTDAAENLRRGYYVARKIHGDDPKPTPRDAEPSEQLAALDAWLRLAERNAALMASYNGTVASAINIYRNHTFSRLNKVKHNTASAYRRDLKLIESTVGRRLIRNLTVVDIHHWYDEWREPEFRGGPERIDRAHNPVGMFRTVTYFLAALRIKECKVLAGELEKVKFEKRGAREEELSYSQCAAFIKTALQFGKNGIMPADRCLYLAIATAAQFELMLRQMDIIGEWAKKTANRKLPVSITTLEVGSDMWAGFFTGRTSPAGAGA